MAQAQPENIDDGVDNSPHEIVPAAKEDDGRFRFNAQAPEFVPRSSVPVTGYFYPCYHFLGGSASSPDWILVEDPSGTPPSVDCWVASSAPGSPSSKGVHAISDELQHKIIKQVEYQFSDISLLANETLAKQTSKDPEGYVPISVIASTKKIKSLTTNNLILAQALRSSSKLAVSDDGKKVRRIHPFTERKKEELQSRTVVAENLPDDHSHQNLEKIFRVAGSVKTVRVCHPQDSNSSRAKGDFFVSNKLHALVEFESTEVAERAVDKLNDERNWRKGLRVRLLLRCSPKSVLKNRRSDFESEDDDSPHESGPSGEDAFHPNHTDSPVDSHGEESSPTARKAWGRVRGKTRGRGQTLGVRGLIKTLTPQVSNLSLGEASPRHACRGPRMPDGTRGFTMGRGTPLNS